MKYRFRALLVAMLSSLVIASASAEAPFAELATVEHVDLQKYMGHWEEFARFPNKFQEKCVGESSTDYFLNPDSSVRVTNRCRLANGELDEIEGKARRIGAEGSAKLEVRFAPAWLSFIPAVWGKYWIIDIDPDYQMVAVGEPKREYLWILTRGQPVSTATYMALLSRLVEKGYDTKQLVFSNPPSRK